MKASKLMMSLGVMFAAAAPLGAHAAGGTLNLWGEAFAKVHQTKDTQPSTPNADISTVASAMASGPGANLTGKVMGSAQLDVANSLNAVDMVYQQLGGTVETLATNLTNSTGTVLQGVQNVAQALTQNLNNAVDVGVAGSLVSSLNLPPVLNASGSASLADNAQLLSSLPVASLPVAQVNSITSGLVQNVVAARPASLLGILK